MKIVDIGEVCERSGTLPSALRYYEEIGLIRSIGRVGLRRQYDASVVLKLSLVELGKTAGFSLSEIAGMFGPDGTLKLPREDLHEKADDIERQMRDLRALRDALRHVADCPAPTHLECPSFRRLLTTARSAKTKSRRRRKAPAKAP